MSAHKAASGTTEETPREKMLASLVNEACDKGEALASDYHDLQARYASLDARLRELVKEWQNNASNWDESTLGHMQAAIFRNCAASISALLGDAE